ncbi:enoyl-CoA hydratase/isomerase family protein [Paenisporosarcina sp. TG-14]|uniref:enoyl-CoA hydratase/isomerase family protein n=1 Tax=Paenisporosarcina sp. TG-14 TaxID=1231057 RepID=UPI0003142083|nr:enoyl-CoA hydratase-related protein [Paenisporosarcina sp. TG-14]
MKNISVNYSVENGVGLIKLNEPKSRNALSTEIKKGLLTSLDLAEEDPEVKIVIISGEGTTFCAGGDIKGMGSRTTLESVEKINITSRIAIRMEAFRKPIIASVTGYAVGAGFSLALASDIIFADEESKFGLSFSKVGLIPDCGALYYLPRMVGPWKAKELIFSGEMLSSNQAQNLGIVNRIFPKGQVFAESVLFAEGLAKGPAQTMQFVKTIISKTANQSLAGTVEYENYAQSILQQTDDHAEGILAFKEKRKPVFEGK